MMRMRATKVIIIIIHALLAHSCVEQLNPCGRAANAQTRPRPRNI